MTAGERKGSPRRYLMAVHAIDNQKLFWIMTEPTKKGSAHMLPRTQTHALHMGRPLPNLSAIIPPPIEDTKPQIIFIREKASANCVL